MKWLSLLLATLLLVGCVSATSTYVSQYPPGFNLTYINATTTNNSFYWANNTADPSISLVGAAANRSWRSQFNINSSQRMNFDLGSQKIISNIYYENYHNAGIDTTYGVQNFTIWGSNVSGSFANRTYSNDTGWVELVPSQYYFTKHTSPINASEPGYVTINNSVPYQYYSLKLVNNYGHTSHMGLRRIELQSAVTWDYSTPGTYTWVCPNNTTVVSVQIIGGGGAGKGGTASGYGGNRGQYQVKYNIPVVPGTGYPLTVGAGGANSTGDGAAGSPSTMFGYGSLGGATQTQTIGYGSTSLMNGSSGYVDAVDRAFDGGGFIWGGGYSGLGYGAGGGGAKGNSTAPYYEGGGGAPGYVRIATYDLEGENYPNFIGTPTTASPGSLVSFIDDSTIGNTTGLQYLWDFGDGTTSNSSTSINHVYAYLGSYTVSLTLSNSGVLNVTESKEAYINIVTPPTVYANPRTVSFSFIDYVNNPIPGLTVNVTPLNATMPASWAVEYYGFSSGVTITETGFTGITGSDGSWAAPMSESIRYSLNLTNATSGISYTYDFYPSKTVYLVRIPTSDIVVPPTPSSNYISYTMSNVTVNSTHEFFNVTYHDTSGGTSSLLFTVKNSSGSILYNNTTSGFGTSAIALSSGALQHGAGETYTYRISAPQSQVGFVNKTATITWENLRTLEGYPDWVGQWLGVLVLVVLAGSVGFAGTKYMLIILPIVTFFMLVYTRWLQPVIGVTAMVSSLGILLVLGVLRYIRDAKNRMGRP